MQICTLTPDVWHNAAPPETKILQTSKLQIRMHGLQVEWLHVHLCILSAQHSGVVVGLCRC
jgi:hypothetical protein